MRNSDRVKFRKLLLIPICKGSYSWLESCSLWCNTVQPAPTVTFSSDCHRDPLRKVKLTGHEPPIILSFPSLYEIMERGTESKSLVFRGIRKLWSGNFFRFIQGLAVDLKKQHLTVYKTVKLDTSIKHTSCIFIMPLSIETIVSPKYHFYRN